MWQGGFFSPPRGLCHYMHVVTCNTILVSPCMTLHEKSIYFLSLHCFYSFIQITWIGDLTFSCVVLKKSSAQCLASKWEFLIPFSETDISSISLFLIMFMIHLRVGVPRVTGTLDLKEVKSRMTRTTLSSS